MNAIQGKIHGASKKIAVVLKIGCVVAVVVAMLALVGMALSVSTGALQQSFLAAFDVTANNGTVISVSSENVLVMFVSMLVYAGFMFAILRVLYLVFRDISVEGSPFEKKHVARIKCVGVMTIVMSIAGSFFDGLVDLYTIGEMAWYTDIEGIIFGIIIYCIALIFDYGCDLQQLSDETL